MSRETLLDEAIAKAKECEDWQLVEWLRMARGGESAARWYTGKFAELQAENDKMVMKLNTEHIVRQNVERENAKLRELVVGIGHLLFSLDVDYCVACPRDGINHSCPVYTVDGGECLYKTDMRELGVDA